MLESWRVGGLTKNLRGVLLSSLRAGQSPTCLGGLPLTFGWKASLTQQQYLLGIVLGVAVMQAIARLPDNCLKSFLTPVSEKRPAVRTAA